METGHAIAAKVSLD